MPAPKLAESTLTFHVATQAGATEPRAAGQLMLVLAATPVEGLPSPATGISTMQVDTFGFDGQRLDAQGLPEPVSPSAAVQLLVGGAVIVGESLPAGDARRRLLLEFAATYFELFSQNEGVSVESLRELEGASNKDKVH